jgi:hypothetical protein
MLHTQASEDGRSNKVREDWKAIASIKDACYTIGAALTTTLSKEGVGLYALKNALNEATEYITKACFELARNTRSASGDSARQASATDVMTPFITIAGLCAVSADKTEAKRWTFFKDVFTNLSKTPSNSSIFTTGITRVANIIVADKSLEPKGETNSHIKGWPVTDNGGVILATDAVSKCTPPHMAKHKWKKSIEERCARAATLIALSQNAGSENSRKTESGAPRVKVESSSRLNEDRHVWGSRSSKGAKGSNGEHRSASSNRGQGSSSRGAKSSQQAQSQKYMEHSGIDMFGNQM